MRGEVERRAGRCALLFIDIVLMHVVADDQSESLRGERVNRERGGGTGGGGDVVSLNVGGISILLLETGRGTGAGALNNVAVGWNDTLADVIHVTCFVK